MSSNTNLCARIDESLRPREGRQPSELAVATLDGLEAALQGIAAGDVPGGYTIAEAAAALGYLLASCTEQAASATRRVVVPYALPPSSRQATTNELLAGVACLRALLDERHTANGPSIQL